MSNDDNQIEGNNNIVAGRDVVISDTLSLSKKLQERMHDIDKKINEILPNSILSPTRNNALVKFSSGKMLQSLSKLGIPIEAAIEVMDNIDGILVELIDEEEQITTRALRKSVTKSIYTLDVSKYGSTTLQLWGDQYARRYGDPESQITVIERDGENHPLVYKYIIKQLLPQLIEKLLKIPYEEIEGKFINQTHMRFMAENILEHVKSMNLYKIQYKTLFNLAEDLSTQPPHPWFVQKPFLNEIVAYDLERAKAHKINIPTQWNNKEISSCWHSTVECVYHSCSAILAFYGCILGGSELAPLYHLINILKICEKKDYSVVWEHCNITQIEGDLYTINKSIHSVLRVLNKTAKYSTGNSEKSLKNLINYSQNINEIAVDLINSHTELNDLGSEEKINALPEKDFHLAIINIFKKVFKYNSVIDICTTKGYWFIHDIDSALFRDIKAEILILPILDNVNCENISHICIDSLNMIQHHKFSNTVIFILPGSLKYQENRNYIEQEFLGNKNNFIILALVDLINLCRYKDRIELLEQLIINNGN